MTHYKFIEIGTSNFNTLIQKATDEDVGLSVEPLKEYLDTLPNPTNVRKVCAAVSNTTGEMDIFYVPNATRREHKLPSWMKGTNSVGAPHPTVVRYLAAHGLSSDLIKQQSVPVISVADLFTEYGVSSVEFLKIDTEGHDAVILNAYLDLLALRPEVRAQRIVFESNSLTPLADRVSLRARLAEHGYTVKKVGDDILATS